MKYVVIFKKWEVTQKVIKDTFLWNNFWKANDFLPKKGVIFPIFFYLHELNVKSFN